MHALRHHFASVLIANGIDVVTVAAWLGHENSILVQTTYAHLMPDAASRGRAVLTTVWEQDVDSTWTEGSR
jgi:integrase